MNNKAKTIKRKALILPGTNKNLTLLENFLGNWLMIQLFYDTYIIQRIRHTLKFFAALNMEQIKNVIRSFFNIFTHIKQIISIRNEKFISNS